MQQLSAAEAVGPALERTKLVLWSHRDWRLYLKLSAVAALAALGSGFNFNFNVPSKAMSGAHSPAMAAVVAALMAAAVVVGLAAFLFFLALVYTGSRMQFVLIDVVARRETLIAPLWRRYGAQTWRWIGLKFAIFLAFMAAVLVAMVPIFLALFRQMKLHGSSSASMSPGHALSFIGSILAILLLVLIFFLVAWQVRGFVLPVMALENAPAGEGFRRLRLIWRHEPAQMLLYLSLRLILGIALGALSVMVTIVGVLLIALPVGGTAWALWSTSHTAGMKAIVIAVGIFAAAFAVAWCLLLYIGVSGFASVFLQAYTLYFYGGRYPLLGEILEPPGTSWWNLEGIPVPPSPPPPMIP